MTHLLDQPQHGWTILLGAHRAKDVIAFGRVLSQIPLRPRLTVVPDGGEVLAYFTGGGNYSDRETHPFPNLLFLDCRLRGLSGLSVLCWLRNEPRFAQLPVILFCARFSDEQVETAGRLQAACCSKTSTPMQIQDAITRSVRLALGSDREHAPRLSAVWEVPDRQSRSTFRGSVSSALNCRTALSASTLSGS